MTDKEIEILKKWKILKPDGTERTVRLTRPLRAGDQPQGVGPLIAPDALSRLLNADTTPDKHWLDWIFFQAGGGETAKRISSEALQRIKESFIDELTHGYTDRETGQHHGPVPHAEAVERWDRVKSRFSDLLTVGDQDKVRHLRVFGYFREWPGNANIYAHVVEAITNYLKIYPKLLQMNKELAREGGEPLPTKPEDIPTWENMLAVASHVERYFASKKARTDIREETIYDDDVIRALAPLTYAAAVKYGYEGWPWADPKAFNDLLTASGKFDEWQEYTTGKIIVYLTFKVPVPAWIARKGGEWQMKDLTDLAIYRPQKDFAAPFDSWLVFDQENNLRLKIADVKKMILDEPTRTDSEEEDSPFKRGANVYKDAAEAQHVVASLDRALRAVQTWAEKFDVKKIKTNTLKL